MKPRNRISVERKQPSARTMEVAPVDGLPIETHDLQVADESADGGAFRSFHMIAPYVASSTM